MRSLSYRLIKRLGDILGGVAGCVITAILFLLLAPLIYHASPGPIFFSQTRIGKNGKPFKLYKFRSMYPDAENKREALWKRNEMTGPIFRVTDDPRVIPGIGEAIRKKHIDEFPQFWNVLKGEMSIVGTRPPLMDEWIQYDALSRARVSIKPGITGLWQVSNQYHIKDFKDILQLDLTYIEKQSLALDAKIIWLTVWNLFPVRKRKCKKGHSMSDKINLDNFAVTEKRGDG